jgi:hypothetical protein
MDGAGFLYKVQRDEQKDFYMGDDTKTGGMKPEVQPLTSPIGTGNQAGKLPQTSPIDTGNQAGKLPQTSPIDTGNQAGEKTSLQDAGDGYVNF